MNFYNLPRGAELTATLKAIARAFSKSEMEVPHAGRMIRKQITSRGREFFSFDAGLPTKVNVYRGATGNSVFMELGLIKTEMTNNKETTETINIRGQVKFDRSGEPNAFFFDPYEDGRSRGNLEGKLELVTKGFAKPAEVFTEEEIQRHKAARNLTEDQANKLIREIAHSS